jgi:hypothetical protein
MLTASVLTLLALPLTGLANPVLTKRVVDQPVFDTIEYYGQYASASYCTANFGGASTKVACRVNNCQKVQDNNQTITQPFAE